MRAVDEQMEVTVTDGQPESFRWCGQLFQISEVLHTWSVDEGGWWIFKKPVKRRFYRVHAEGYRSRITAELCSPEGDKESDWVLAAVYE